MPSITRHTTLQRDGEHRQACRQSDRPRKGCDGRYERRSEQDGGRFRCAESKGRQAPELVHEHGDLQVGMRKRLQLGRSGCDGIGRCQGTRQRPRVCCGLDGGASCRSRRAITCHPPGRVADTRAADPPPPLSVRGVPPPSPQELYAAVLLLYLKLAKVIRGLTPPTASDVKRLMSEVGRLARRASRVARRSSSAALMRTMRGLGTRVTRETPRRTSDPFLPPTDHARARRSRRRVGAGWLRRWRPSSWRTRRIAHSSTTSQGTARMV